MRMRLLLLGDLSSPHTSRWAEALSSDHDVLVVGFGDYDGSADHVSLGANPASGGAFAAAVVRVQRIVRQFRPDLVHAHYVASYGVLGHLAGRSLPVVQFAWGSDVLLAGTLPRFQRTLMRRALAGSALIVADSHHLLRAASSMAPAVPTEHVVFGPPIAWTEVERHPQHVILSPRALRPVYNIQLILDAYAMAEPRVGAWSLEVLTGGLDPSEQGLTEPRAMSGMSFLPRLSVEELQATYLRAEVVCSVPSSDGTSVSLLEAMGSGCLPIVSDLPANRAWVEDGVNGLMVPAGDTEALAEALVRAVRDDALRERAVGANRVLIAQNASWEDSVEQIERLSARLGLR